ncbi:hypothetical protein Q9189_007652 [Teloschistes chrysophthalmus]
MEGFQRNQIIHSLKIIIDHLNIATPYYTKAKALDELDFKEPMEIDPYASKFAFHCWVNQTFRNIHNPSPELCCRLLNALGVWQYTLNMKINDDFGGLQIFVHQNKSQLEPYFDQRDAETFKKLENAQKPKPVRKSADDEDDFIIVYVSDEEKPEEKKLYNEVEEEFQPFK